MNTETKAINIDLVTITEYENLILEEKIRTRNNKNNRKYYFTIINSDKLHIYRKTILKNKNEFLIENNIINTTVKYYYNNKEVTAETFIDTFKREWRSL